MIRTALGLLAAATCVPVIAIAATMGVAGASSSGRVGDAVSLQFEPHGSRGDAVSVRAQRDAGEAVEFEPSSGTSSRSPMGACASANGANNASGVCRDTLLGTGKHSGGKDFPLDFNDWESDNEEDVWPDTLPGQSSEDVVISAFVPASSDSIGELDADDLGGAGEIGGENNIGDVPEPSTVLLMGGSLFALGYFRKKRSS